MKVVGLHGIAHTFLTAPQIEETWFPALLGGLQEAGAPGLGHKDFAMVGYGAEFRPAGQRGTDSVGIEDLTPWEKDMLVAWWREAARLSAENRAKGGADLRREGKSRRLGLELQARIEGLLPPLAAAIFAGTTELRGDLAFADDGAVEVSRLAVASRNARLDIAGRLDAERNIDMTIAAGAISGGDGKTVAAGI